MQRHSFKCALTGLLIAIIAAAVFTNPVFAQEVVEVAEGITMDEVNEVARELWCPLCSGVRLDACELKACIQMKEMIALKLAEDEDTETIKAYFVEQYGPQVLGEPPKEGFNWLAWILPVVAFVFGGVFLWRQMNSMMQPSKQPQTQTASMPPPPASPTDVTAEAPKDEYELRLEEELSRYD